MRAWPVAAAAHTDSRAGGSAPTRAPVWGWYLRRGAWTPAPGSVAGVGHRASPLRAPPCRLPTHGWHRSAHEPKQRVHAAHPRPGEGAIEQRGGVAADDLAVAGGLALECGDVAHGVDAALDRIIVWINRSPAGRLPRMRLDPGVVMVEADGLGIRAGTHVLTAIAIRHRVDRLRDDGDLIAADFRLAPQRDVVRRRRDGLQRGVFLGLEVLARPSLRATVHPPAIVLATPLERLRARVVQGREDLAGEAIIPDAGHGALHTSFVPRMFHTRRINFQIPGLRILQKRRRDARRQRVRLENDRLGVIGD